MNKYCTTFLLAGLLSLSVNAEILLVEDFEYDDFSTPLVNQSEWTNDYYNAEYSYANAYITGGLSFSGYAGCGLGNAVVIEGETGSWHPCLGFKPQTSGTVYTAFMFHPAQCYKSGFFFTLRQGVDNNDFTMNGRVFLQVDDNYDAYFGLRFGKSSDIVMSDKLAEPDHVYLVVLKYIINEGDNNDEISLYVLDGFSAEEPAEALIGPIKDTTKPDLTPSYVMLRGLADGWLIYDGIRVATTWEEAVASGVCPEETGVVENEDNSENTPFVLYDILGRKVSVSDNLPHGVYIKSSSTNKVVCHF